MIIVTSNNNGLYLRLNSMHSVASFNDFNFKHLKSSSSVNSIVFLIVLGVSMPPPNSQASVSSFDECRT